MGKRTASSNVKSGALPGCDLSLVQQPRGSLEGKPSGCPQHLPGWRAQGRLPWKPRAFCATTSTSNPERLPHPLPSRFFTPHLLINRGCARAGCPSELPGAPHLCALHPVLPAPQGHSCHPSENVPSSLSSCSVPGRPLQPTLPMAGFE